MADCKEMVWVREGCRGFVLVRGLGVWVGGRVGEGFVGGEVIWGGDWWVREGQTIRGILSCLQCLYNV